MKRETVALVTTALVVLAAVGAAPAAAAVFGTVDVAGSTGTTADQAPGAAVANESTNGTDDEIPPGQRLAGAIGVQGAEVRGEVETRAFANQLGGANGDAAKASVIARQLGDTEQLLTELQNRKGNLTAAYEAGNLSQGAYRAQLAVISARIRLAERMTARTANATQGIPDDVLRANGVNASAIEELRTRASELSGPEVAAIAKTIGGPPAGGPLGRPTNVGPPNGTSGEDRGRGNDGGNGADRGNGNGNAGSVDGAAGAAGDAAGNATDAVDNAAGNATDGAGDAAENATGNATDAAGDAVDGATDGATGAAGNATNGTASGSGGATGSATGSGSDGSASGAGSATGDGSVGDGVTALGVERVQG